MRRKDSALRPSRLISRRDGARAAKWISLFLVFRFQLYASHPWSVSPEVLVAPFLSFSTSEWCQELKEEVGEGGGLGD